MLPRAVVSRRHCLVPHSDESVCLSPLSVTVAEGVGNALCRVKEVPLYFCLATHYIQEVPFYTDFADRLFSLLNHE